MSGFNAVLARNTKNAPQNPGISSQTVAFSHYNNFSAQLPIDPATGALVAGGVKEQARQCFRNIEAVLSSIGHRMSDVVRLSVFVRNILDADLVDEVFAEYFQAYVPARTTAAVASLPMDALVQIEVLISNGEGTIPNAPQAGDLIKLVNNTANAPVSALSSQTVSFSHYNNLTAQLPVDPRTGRVIDADAAAQAAQCLRNIKAILESIDVPMDDIVKINLYLTDLADLAAVDRVYATFFPDSAIARACAYVPARTVIAAAALPMGALVQMEAVVSHGDGTPPQLVEDRHGIVIRANNTPKAPRNPLATQTVAFSHYNHLSAQLPVDAETGALVSGGIKEQAACCLTHIKTIVESIGHSLEDVVKVNLFLRSMDDLEAVNAVYKEFFPAGTPARRVVGVSDLPQDALIQIDAVISNAEGTPPAK
jgi:reactive intermediate/imine deaminase